MEKPHNRIAIVIEGKMFGGHETPLVFRSKAEAFRHLREWFGDVWPPHIDVRTIWKGRALRRPSDN